VGGQDSHSSWTNQPGSAHTQDRVGLQKQITELEEDLAAARTALRRMIKEQSIEQ
jgi:hypothetical protein